MQLEMKSGKGNKSRSSHYYLLKTVWKENITLEEHLHKCNSKCGFCCWCHLSNDLVSRGFSSSKLLHGCCEEDSGTAPSITQQKKAQSQTQHADSLQHTVNRMAAAGGRDTTWSNAAAAPHERTRAELLKDVLFMWNSRCPHVPAPWERDRLLRIWAKSFLFLEVHLAEQRISFDRCCGCERPDSRSDCSRGISGLRWCRCFLWSS